MMAHADGSFDSRPYVRLDHGMPENPKIVGLSNSAFRLFVSAICWCSRQETDGVIPDVLMRKLGSAKAIAELVKAGLLDDRGGEYAVHDYLDFQRSSQEIRAYRDARGKVSALGNHQRWHVARRKRDDKCEFCQGVPT